MGTGKIVDFSKGGYVPPREEVKRVEQNQARSVEVIDGKKGVETPPIEIRQHEEVIVQGQDNIRRKKDGSPDLRFRAAKDPKAWDKVKRGDDE